MAKKQTRRSVSLSRTTYERLRAYCDTNGLSMSRFVETRIGDYLGRPKTPPAPIVAHDDSDESDEEARKKIPERFFTF